MNRSSFDTVWWYRIRDPKRSEGSNNRKYAPCHKEPMLGDIGGAENIYLACGNTDIKKSIDGLSAIVQQNFQPDPFSNSVFLFCGCKSNRIKALFWEGDGFVL